MKNLPISNNCVNTHTHTHTHTHSARALVYSKYFKYAKVSQNSCVNNYKKIEKGIALYGKSGAFLCFNISVTF